MLKSIKEWRNRAPDVGSSWMLMKQCTDDFHVSWGSRVHFSPNEMVVEASPVHHKLSSELLHLT